MILSNQSGIYSITSPSGKQYIGSAAHFKNRWRLHLRQLTLGRHHNKGLSRAFNKYGAEGLKFEILLICRQEDLLMYEQRAIDILKPSYNLCRTAGSPLGVKRSPETIAKISAESAKRTHSSESRARMSESWVGRTFSEVHRAKISAARLGHEVSEETREKIRQSLSGRKRPDEEKAKISATMKGRPGRPQSDAAKEKIKAARKLQVTTDETRAKLSAALRARWAAKKAAQTVISTT